MNKPELTYVRLKKNIEYYIKYNSVIYYSINDDSFNHNRDEDEILYNIKILKDKYPNEYNYLKNQIYCKIFDDFFCYVPCGNFTILAAMALLENRRLYEMEEYILKYYNIHAPPIYWDGFFYIYSKLFTDKRWPELEDIIINKLSSNKITVDIFICIISYSRYFSRIKVIEDIILNCCSKLDGRGTYKFYGLLEYARKVIRKKWPDAEPIFSKNTRILKIYCYQCKTDISGIGEEKILKQDPKWYIHHLQKILTPEELKDKIKNNSNILVGLL